MSAMPKAGTIERMVLDKLIENGERGVAQFDFNNPPITEKRLAEAIKNLQEGLFQSELKQ